MLAGPAGRKAVDDCERSGSRGPGSAAREARWATLLGVSEVWVDRVRPRAPVFGERVETGRGGRSDQKTKVGSGGGLAGAREGPVVGSPAAESSGTPGQHRWAKRLN